MRSAALTVSNPRLLWLTTHCHLQYHMLLRRLSCFTVCICLRFQGLQGKSPYANSSSPLPSPASVGSTASTCSGGSTQDPSPSCGAISVPRHIVNKATEHLTISGYVSQSLELWTASTTIMDQCRGKLGVVKYWNIKKCVSLAVAVKHFFYTVYRMNFRGDNFSRFC